MLLTDHEIQEIIHREMLTITPFEEDQLQPASYDLKLGHTFLIATNPNGERWGDPVHHTADNPLTILPGQFMLASTLETVELSSRIAGQVEGKSTLARRGLQIHAAGFVDPGFCGQLTLELFNMAPWPILLKPEMLVAQIKFELLQHTPDRPYDTWDLGSHYQNQTGPTPARHTGEGQ